MEDGEEEEIKEEEEEEEEEEKSEKVVQLWSPKKFQRDYITSDPSVTCGSARKVAGSEGHEFNDVLQPLPLKHHPPTGLGSNLRWGSRRSGSNWRSSKPLLWAPPNATTVL